MDDFEKFRAGLPPITDWMHHSKVDPLLRAAYEAGQAARDWELFYFERQLCVVEDILSAAQKVIEAAERVDDAWGAAIDTMDDDNIVRTEEWEAWMFAHRRLRRALADYHAVTKDDLTPSSPTSSAPQRDIQSSVDTSHESGSALQGGEK